MIEKKLFAFFFYLMKDFNEELKKYPEENLISEMQNYVSYLPLNEPLLGAYNEFKFLSRGTIDSNFTEHEQNNHELGIRIQFVRYIRLIKRFSTNFQGRPRKEDVENFFNSLGQEELQNIYDQAKKDLEIPSQVINEMPCQLIPFLKAVSLNWDDENPMIKELILHCTTQPKIVFYPSSYTDQSDIEYFEREGDNKFGQHSIFIHVEYHDDYPQFNEENIFFSTCFSDLSTLSITKHLNDKKEVIWLIFFNQTKNEDVFQKIVEHNLQIHTLISKCDGIVSGGPRPDGYCVPTLFYLCFCRIIGLKFIFTEYGTLLWNEMNDPQGYVEDFKNWIEANLHQDISFNILAEINNRSVPEIISYYSMENRIEGTGMRGCAGMNPQLFLLRIKF